MMVTKTQSTLAQRLVVTVTVMDLKTVMMETLPMEMVVTALAQLNMDGIAQSLTALLPQYVLKFAVMVLSLYQEMEHQLLLVMMVMLQMETDVVLLVQQKQVGNALTNGQDLV